MKNINYGVVREERSMGMEWSKESSRVGGGETSVGLLRAGKIVGLGRECRGQSQPGFRGAG